MTTAIKPARSEATRKHITSLFRAFNSHDATAVVAHFTDDVQWFAPMLDEPVVGREAAQREVEATFTAMPDLHFPLGDVEIFTDANGAKAIAHYTFSGTMTGSLNPPGFAPTGRRADIEGACLYEMRDGLIAKHTVIFDGLRLAQDLGLLPASQSIVVKVLVGAQRLVNDVVEGVTGLVRR